MTENNNPLGMVFPVSFFCIPPSWRFSQGFYMDWRVGATVGLVGPMIVMIAPRVAGQLWRFWVLGGVSRGVFRRRLRHFMLWSPAHGLCQAAWEDLWMSHQACLELKMNDDLWDLVKGTVWVPCLNSVQAWILVSWQYVLDRIYLGKLNRRPTACSG